MNGGKNMDLKILRNNVLKNDSVNTENENYFKQECAKWKEYFFGVPGCNTINLVASMSDAQSAYLHYLKIGAKPYNSDNERWEAILNELTAKEFLYVNMYTQNNKKGE